MQRHYRAFISYSWEDRRWAKWLHRSLEQFRTPRALVGQEGDLGPVPRSLHPIFKDREEQAAGYGIAASLEAALDASEYLVVICSPRAAQSQWVSREVAWFKHHKAREKILAVIVDGEPCASLAADASPEARARECFPQTLIYAVDEALSATDQLEDVPLAADARKAGDGRRLAKLKLAAALLGVGVDDLIRRDERRRAVRRRWVTGAMGAVTASMTALAWVAVDQRDAAETAREDAEFQRDQAEGLVEFMITDMRRQLDAVGRLDVLDTTARRTLEYYERQSPERLTPDALGRRARAMLLLGEVHNSKGDLDRALSAYQAAAGTTREQLRRDPDRAQRIFDHSQSVFWVGYIAWQRGDAGTARQYFSRYNELAERLVRLDPGNNDWQAELEYSLSNLGILELEQGNAAAAEAHFRESLRISSSLMAADPLDLERTLSAGTSFAWLTDALLAGLKFDEARVQRISELALYERARSASPDNHLVLEREVAARRSLAIIALYQGDLPAAERQIMRAREVAGRLLEADSANTLWLEFAGRAAVQHAELLIHLDQLAAAEAALEEAMTIGRSLLERDPDVFAWRRDLISKASILLARTAVLKGEGADALRRTQEARRQTNRLVERFPDDVVASGHYGIALKLSILAGEQPPERWTEIIEILNPERGLFPPEALSCLAQAQVLTGHDGEARAIATRLIAAGYRHPDFIALLKDHPVLVEPA